MFVIETYDHTSGQEEEQSFTDLDVALAEFKRMHETYDPQFSISLRRD